MRERLKRRKKSVEVTPEEPKQAPLQPAYFDAGSAEAEPADEPEPEAVSEPAAEEENAAEPQELPQDESQPAQPRADGQRRGRRRRGRGGRGRGKQSSPPAELPVQAPAPGPDAIPVVASIPAVSEQPTAPKAPKGVVVLAVGLPGSGKSTWFKRHNITPLSSDMLRALLFDDPSEQRFQDLIFSNLRSMLKARLIARRPVNYVDATNLTPHDRQGWIKLAKDFGYEPQAVFFDVPLDVCQQRNQKRQRVVTDEVMQRFAGKLKPPTFDEGFTKITVVRVKQKE